MGASLIQLHLLVSIGTVFALPFSAALVVSLRSRIARRSLSSFSLVIMTLDGWIPTFTVEPLLFSRVTRSMWITYFLRFTWITLPSRPTFFPRTTMTSSSLRIGMDLTLYFCTSSLLRWELMIFLLTLDGAVKCALRDLRRDDDTFWLYFMLSECPH